MLLEIRTCLVEGPRRRLSGVADGDSGDGRVGLLRRLPLQPRVVRSPAQEVDLQYSPENWPENCLQKSPKKPGTG